jgi:LmbE family N-acetylglucosaminyl deacetylase
MIKDIINNRTPCYFISPHLDDAVFSAGGILSKLQGKVPLHVINVFTNPGDGILSMSARAYMRQCGYTSPDALFRQRIKEDSKALSQFGITPHNLSYTDALFRKKNGNSNPIAELSRVYPTYRYHVISGVISSHDRTLMDSLQADLKRIITDPNARIFCPVGFGNHVDHLLVRDVCTQIFSKKQIIFWSDFPYVFRNTVRNSFIEQNALDIHDISPDFKAKRRACSAYVSQYSQVIPDASTIKHTERYYTYGSRYSSIAYTSTRRGLLSHARAFISAPKNYVFDILFTKLGIVTIQPYSRKQGNLANRIIRRIRTALPNAACQLIGSTGLKLSGQGDIDLIVSCIPNQIDNYSATISALYGRPDSIHKNFVQWKLQIDGYEVDLDLMTFDHPRNLVQSSLFRMFETSEERKAAYEQFKWYTASFTQLQYAIARTLFFTGMTNAYSESENFPSHLDSYSLNTVLSIDKPASTFAFATYSGPKNTTVFVKRCRVSDHRAFRQLEHEARISMLCSSENIPGSVTTPAFRAFTVSSGYAYFMSQFISGTSLAHISSNKKAHLFAGVISYLSLVTKRLTQDQRTQISRREPLFWIILGFYSSVKVLVSQPSLSFLILRSLNRIVRNAWGLLFRSNRRLIHRDLNDWALIRTRSNTHVLDFQLSCIADPLMEYAVLFVKYANDPEFISSLQKNEQYIQDVPTNTEKQLLDAYRCIVAMHDLSITNGHHSSSLRTLLALSKTL